MNKDRKPAIYIWILGWMWFFVACSKSEPFSRILTQIDSIICVHTDSAEGMLYTLSDADLSGKEKADYWRLRTKLHALKGKSTVEDSLITYSLEYYKKHQWEKELKESYQLILTHLLWKNEPADYEFYTVEAIQLAVQSRDSLFLHDMYRILAKNHYSKKEYRLAYQNYVKALACHASSSSAYMAGLSYSLQDYPESRDSIDYWMQKAIYLAKKQNDTTRIRHYYRNYADIQIRLAEYDKAISNIREMKKYDTCSFSVEDYMMAEIFLQKHELDSAQFYLNKMSEQDFEADDNRSFNFTRKGLAVFQSILSYAKGGTFDFGIIGQYTDSLFFDQDKKRLKFEEQVFAKQQLEERNLKLTIRKQQIQLVLLGLLFLIAAGGMVVYVYIKRKRERLFRLEEKMESLRDLMADISGELMESRKNSSFFKKVLLKQLGLIRLTASNPTAQNQEILYRMAQLAHEKVPVDSLIVWDELYALVDSLYDNFYTVMKHRYGEILTEKEMQLCCLLCADFSTKEISVITQQGIRTIYQRKTTIREKLKMQQSEDIVQFIKL